MAKRFTDTDKWKKPRIRAMKAAYKLLWLYVLDECDHAGIWHVDLEVAQIRIGEKLKLSDAVKTLGEKIYVFDDGQKWFIPDFIEFQYGKLNEINRAHQSVLKILSKYDLLEIKNKPLTSPLQGAKDKDKDMDMDMDMDKEPVLEGGMGETKEKNWQLWVTAWFEFYEQKHQGIKPSFNSVQASALKKIKSYLTEISSVQHPDQPPDGAGLNAWLYVLQHWEKLDPWLQTQFDLTVINKKINDIINRLKNGKSSRQSTGGEVNTARAFAKIDQIFTGDRSR